MKESKWLDKKAIIFAIEDENTTKNSCHKIIYIF